jgi:porin
MTKSTVQTILVSFACFISAFAQAQNQGPESERLGRPTFGGPDAVENVLADQYNSWDKWQKGLKDDHGIALSFDYTAVFLSANDVSANNTAAGGIARLYGAFNFAGDGSSALVFKVEHRHEFGSPSPFEFSLGELGYVGLQEPPFSDAGSGVTNLYWRQRFGNGRSTIIAGILDPTDYVDAFALASPWLHFMNFAFSTGSAAIGLPNDAAVGVAYATMLDKNMYIIAGITDINGDPSKPFDGFDNFFSNNKYFTSFELGWTSSRDRIMLDNFHLTAWHKDRQSSTGTSDGYGLAFSYSRYVNDRLMPFVRGGYAKDGGSLLQKSLSLGVGYQTDAFSGLVGAAFNWGQPNDDTFVPGLEDQYAIEIFYRVPILKRFAITGDVQYIKDPALNPSENTIWMFNLRGRGAF